MLLRSYRALGAARAFSLLLWSKPSRGHLLPAATTGEFLINYRGGPKARSAPSPYHQRGPRARSDPETVRRQRSFVVGATTPTSCTTCSPRPSPPRRHAEGGGARQCARDPAARESRSSRSTRGIRRRRSPFAAGAFARAGGRTMRPLPGLRARSRARCVDLSRASTHAAFRGWYAAGCRRSPPLPLTLRAGLHRRRRRPSSSSSARKRRLSRFFSPSVVREIVRSQRRRRGAGVGPAAADRALLRHPRLHHPVGAAAPEDVVEFLREYLTVMTDAVFRHWRHRGQVHRRRHHGALQRALRGARTTPPRRCGPRWSSSAGSRAWRQRFGPRLGARSAVRGRHPHRRRGGGHAAARRSAWSTPRSAIPSTSARGWRASPRTSTCPS